MENNENSNSALDESSVEQVEEEMTISAGTPLLDTLALMEKENFQPTIPDAVIQRMLQVSGCVTTDPKVTKLISLAAQTFVAVLAKDALQHYKMRGAPQSNKFRGKDSKDEAHNTLHMEDLISSMEDRGIKVRKPIYFV